MFVLSRKKEKVEAGMEQSSCRTVSIRLRMLDTAQVEYRKLSEVHLQYRVDDNQPECMILNVARSLISFFERLLGQG